MKNIKEKIEQTAVVLIDREKEIPGSFGGIFVGAQIIKEANNNATFVRNLISKYKDEIKVPPLIASDFENGCGTMINGLTPLPYLMGLGATNSEKLAYDYGKVTALEALSVGSNWSFSPVADLNINPRNPIVNVRGISDNADTAIPLLKNVVKGMQENGLAACAKHFPGDGVDWRDQHITTSKNLLSLNEWKMKSGRVFEEIIAAGVYSIMAGHIAFPAYQKEKFKNQFYLPATLSNELISGLLKQEMGFKGVVISDALNMGGFLGWYKNREQSEIECFKAGCDMLLWPTQNYIKNMMQAVESGFVSIERLDDAYKRIMEMKEKLGLFNMSSGYRELSADEKEFIGKTQKTLCDKSVTLIRDKNKNLPLSAGNLKKIIIVPVTHYLPAIKEALHLKEAIEKRGVKVEYLEKGIPESELETVYGDTDYVIYALFTRSFRPAGPIDFFADEAMKIANSQKYGIEKAIIVSFGSPYFINQYFEKADIFINAYTMLEPAIKAFVRALFGEIPFQSFSPVNLDLNQSISQVES
ncbi:MAG: glycoside hydrolase family 3 protein [Calditrichaeota bacterium]|nr:glycoside hydrolase family 3 protein [Calditrichota bacterium]